MLYYNRALYEETCQLKRGENTLPPDLEYLRGRLSERFGIQVINIVYDAINVGTDRGTPRLQVIVETAGDLERIRD